MINNYSVEFKHASLIYDLYYDKTNTLKEYMVNLVHRRKYVDVGKDKLYALKDINLKINHGERLGIIGLNGSGKSTMLKLIAGLLKPSQGDLEVAGNVQPLIEIGAGFNLEFSGRENIYLNGAMLGFNKKQIKEKEKEIIEFTELEKFIDVPVKYYSSGMSLRLAFTIATIIRPEILVMDEMLSAGDLEFMQKAKERMDQILTTAKILIIVSHDMGLIRSLARRVIVLQKGEILFDGDTEDAIEFYSNMVSDKIEKKEELKKQEEQKELEQQKALTKGGESKRQEELHRQEELSRRIVVKKVWIKNSNKDIEVIMPEDALIFNVEFETNIDFAQFYINLVITDKTGVMVAHFRNDYSEIELKDFKKDSYSIKIHVLSVPFKSSKYKYYFRLVGIKDNEEIISDTKPIEFNILGNKKQHILIKHEWEIVKNNKDTVISK